MKEWTYKLEPHHLVTYQYAVRDRMHSLAKRNWRAEIPFGLLFALLAVLCFLAVFHGYPRISGRRLDLTALITGIGLGALLLLAALWLQPVFDRGLAVKPGGPTLSQRTIQLAENGVHFTGRHMTGFYGWELIQDVTERGDIVILWLEPGLGHAIPKAAFGDAGSVDAFMRDIRSKIRHAP